MATILVPRTVRIVFVPPEAPAIAAGLRAVAGNLRELASHMRSEDGVLDASWEGRSKIRYFDSHLRDPGEAESTASWLDGEAARVASMTVVRYETEWVEVETTSAAATR
jgi:uncharacterized protein YukE